MSYGLKYSVIDWIAIANLTGESSMTNEDL